MSNASPLRSLGFAFALALPLASAECQSIGERLKRELRAARDSIAAAADSTARLLRQGVRSPAAAPNGAAGATDGTPSAQKAGARLSGPTLTIQSTRPALRTLRIPAFEGRPRLGTQENGRELPLPRSAEIPATGMTEDVLGYWHLLQLALTRQRFADYTGGLTATRDGSISAAVSGFALRLLTKESIQSFLCAGGNCDMLRMQADQVMAFNGYLVPLWASGGPAAQVEAAERRFFTEVYPGMLAMATTAPTAVIYVEPRILGAYDATKGRFQIPPSRIHTNGPLLGPGPVPRGTMRGSLGALNRRVAETPVRTPKPSRTTPGELICLPGREEPACPFWAVSADKAGSVRPLPEATSARVFAVHRLTIVGPENPRRTEDLLEFDLEGSSYRVYSDPQLTNLIGEFSYEKGNGAGPAAPATPGVAGADTFAPATKGAGSGEWKVVSEMTNQNYGIIRVERSPERSQFAIGSYSTGDMQSRGRRAPAGTWLETFFIDCSLQRRTCDVMLGYALDLNLQLGQRSPFKPGSPLRISGDTLTINEPSTPAGFQFILPRNGAASLYAAVNGGVAQEYKRR